MGIDIAAFEFLLRANKEFGDFGRTIVLGHQRLLIRDAASEANFAKVLARYRPDLTIDDIRHDYVDRVIGALGGKPCQVMDNSAYEGAEVIHDLNEPLPPELIGRFDTVIDIGTLEHVFNIGEAMKSMANMVRRGGQFLCLNVADNHLGHGFWQFGPEVFFRTFCPAHGYEPRMADLYARGEFQPLRDPEQAGMRLPLKTPGYTYITFAARKVADLPVFAQGWPVQADYMVAWKLFLSRSSAQAGDGLAAERILREAIGKHPSNPLYHAELSRLLRARNGDPAEIEALSARAVELAPDNATAVAERDKAKAHKQRPATPAAPKAAAAAAPVAKPVAAAPRAAPAPAAVAKPAAPAPAPAGAAAPAVPTMIDIGGVSVALDDPCIPQAARDALSKGRYEFKEREIARRLLAPGDRVIELGAGMGVVSLTIAKLIGDDALMSFDANPAIVNLARENVRRAGLKTVVRNAIASPRALAKDDQSMDFYVLNAFAASSTRKIVANKKPVRVPVTILEDEIAAHGANALVFDIEGFEDEIIMNADLSAIDKVVMEIHPNILGRERALELIDRMEAQGLALRADLIFGLVIGFERVTGKKKAGQGSKVFGLAQDMEEALHGGDLKRAAALATELQKPLAANAYFHHRVAQLRRGLGQNAEGLAAAAQAAELGSGDFHLYCDLAAFHAAAGNKDAARRALALYESKFPPNHIVAEFRQRHKLAS